MADMTLTISVDDEDKDLLTRSNFRNFYLLYSKIAKRFLGEKPKGYHIDHIDDDWTNNRRSNLRYITAHENLTKYRKNYYNYLDRRPNRRNRLSSGYYGVRSSILTHTKKGVKYSYNYFKVSLQYKGKRYVDTYYKSDIRAAKRYDEVVINNKLPLPLNFPEDYGL